MFTAIKGEYFEWSERCFKKQMSSSYSKYLKRYFEIFVTNDILVYSTGQLL